MTSHTPGPWYASQTGRDFNICFTPEGHWLATVHDDDEPVTGRTEADARLIAKAPELLVAVKQLREFISKAPSLDFNEDVTLSGIAVYGAHLDRLIAEAEAPR